MTIYKEPNIGPDKWSYWVNPIQPGYKLSCCDCGLVHDFEFRIDEDGEINFRVKRNNRSTGQRRRQMKRKQNDN